MADDSIDISVDPDVSLIKHGNLYKTTVGITVGAEEPYGFNISMQAADSSLSNSIDKSHKITSTQSDTPVELGANQWGYALDNNAGKFSKIPSSSESVANIVDVTKDNLSGCKSVKFCTKRVTYAANIDAAKLSAGNYSTSITYTATAKAAPAPVPTPPAPEPYVPPAPKSNGCRQGSSNCSIHIPRQGYDASSSYVYDNYYGCSSLGGDYGVERACKDHRRSYDNNMLSLDSLLPVKREGGEWVSVPSSNDDDYNYDGTSGNKWTYIAVIDNDDKRRLYFQKKTVVDLKYVTAIYTYVPRYKMEDGKVVFCKQADFASCEGRHDFYGVFSDATVTNYTDGFWVDLKSVMGCSYMMPSTTMYSFNHNTVYDDHLLNSYVFVERDYGSFKEYGANYYSDYRNTDSPIETTAKDLAKAIGSPCY